MLSEFVGAAKAVAGVKAIGRSCRQIPMAILALQRHALVLTRSGYAFNLATLVVARVSHQIFVAVGIHDVAVTIPHSLAVHRLEKAHAMRRGLVEGTTRGVALHCGKLCIGARDGVVIQSDGLTRARKTVVRIEGSFLGQTHSGIPGTDETQEHNAGYDVRANRSQFAPPVLLVDHEMQGPLWEADCLSHFCRGVSCLLDSPS
jgi:hypothetical protein